MVTMYSPQDIRRLVGPAAFARGEVYAQRGRVGGVARRPAAERARRDRSAHEQIVAQVAGGAYVPYLTIIDLVERDGDTMPVYGDCTCPVSHNCKHVAAVLLTYMAQHERRASTAPDERPDRTAAGASAGLVPPQPTKAEWERQLADLATPQPGTAARSAHRIGLQIELTDAPDPTSMYLDRNRRTARTATRLGLRPVTRGKSGRWIRTGSSWEELAYSFDYVRTPENDVLRAMFSLCGADSRYSAPTWIWVNEASAAAMWALLRQATVIGIPFIESGPANRPVRIAPVRAHVATTISADDGGLVIDTRLACDDPALTAALATESRLIGNPVHAVATQVGSGDAQELVLIPTEKPIDQGVADLVRRDAPVRIPAGDLDRFYSTWLPALSSRIDAIRFEDLGGDALSPHPVLTARVEVLGNHAARTTLRWRYLAGDSTVADYPLIQAFDAPGGIRDSDAEAACLARLVAAHPEIAELHARIAGTPSGWSTTQGVETATLLAQVVPQWQLIEADESGFAVQIVGEPAEYRFADGIDVDVEADIADRDWFNLNVRVSVAGRDLPLTDVFTALAEGAEQLLLQDGTVVPLTDERLGRLREAIDQARLLADPRRTDLRVSRYQVKLFEELDSLGLLGKSAAKWRESVGNISQLSEPAPLAIPRGLDAELRSYQQQGYEWLAYRVSNRLGGILADDMGLGKTLQTLAVIAHVRENSSSPLPFLVIAPTSVVGNWAAEARKFAPHLRVTTVEATEKRRGRPIKQVAGEADIVITSYALFRLEDGQYGDVDWAGMVLDEAQFVKNHQSVGYKSVRDIVTPVKIALTGTPLENNLMELWAIMSLVCPGLLPDAKTFAARIARPIERDRDPALIAKLRDAVAPFVLRRTKEVVASDLPDKQENVTEVTLNPRHRKVYDQYLQRERARILGLVDDLDNHRIEVLRSLSILRQASLDVSLVSDEHAAVTSSKLEALFEMLDEILVDGHSVLIFSQFTRFLGKVRDRLSERGIDHAYLDGSTRNRAAQIERFTSGGVPVFLISLKAGGFGLNLTAADYCILLDPWWNPAAEAQAVDRAHRIGQTRQVMVYRMVSQGTIEEKVMALKADKSALFADVIDGAASEAGSAAADSDRTVRVGLTADDIRNLLD